MARTASTHGWPHVPPPLDRRRERSGGRWRRLLAARRALPVLLALALVAALLSVGDVRQVAAAVAAVDRRALLAVIPLLALYEALRWVQWLVLLRGLGLRLPLRANAFAFLLGEIGKSLPAGNYVQSYLLHRAAGVDFAVLAAPATLALLLELVVAFAGLAFLDLGDWHWLRPLALIGLAALGVLTWGAAVAPRQAPRLAGSVLGRRVRPLLAAAARFGVGVACLLRPVVLLPALALSAAYVAVAGGVLVLVLRGLGVAHMAAPEVLPAYAFSLAAGLISPIPADVGVLEAAGVEALLALGVGLSVAVAAMLLNRALSMGATVLLAAVGALVFRAELGRAVAGSSATDRAGDETGDAEPPSSLTR